MNEAEHLMDRLNGLRSSYFVQWAAARMAKDVKGFQNLSVAELVTEYDTAHRLFCEALITDNQHPKEEPCPA